MNLPVTKDEIVELTRDLIRIPSVNPPADTRRCAEIILNKFKKDHIDAEIVEGRKGASNVVARLPGRGKGKILLVNGHMDVVPPGEDWTVDPFGAEIKDHKIYGRGSSDMKSGIASMMAAMIGQKRSGIPFHGEIIFMAVCDEETGSEYGTAYLLKQGKIRMGTLLTKWNYSKHDAWPFSSSRCFENFSLTFPKPPHLCDKIPRS